MAGQAAVIDRERQTRRLDQPGQRVESLPEGGKDEHLVAAGHHRTDPAEQRPKLLGLVDLAGAGGEVGPAEPVQRRSSRMRAGTHEPCQLAQGEQPGWGRRACFGTDAAHHVGVHARLVDAWRDQNRFGQPLREQHRHLAAPMPDHDLARARTQAGQIARRSQIDRPGDMTLPELGRRAEQPGRDEGDELVQILQSVLDGRRREQQQVAGTQAPSQPAGRASRVAQSVRLVGDNDVPRILQER